VHDRRNPAQTNGQGSALMRRLESARDKLSGGRRNLVDGILANLSETVFLSSPELAARFETDPATVVRTVQMLGYSGFGAFSRDLRSHFLANVNPYRVMEAEVADHKGPADHVRLSLQRDLRNLQTVNDSIDTSVLPELGMRLRRCRQVLVVAGDLEHCFAEFLAYALSGLGINATAPHGEGLTLHRQRALTVQDACIGIAFRRCLRVPVEAIREARARGAFTLAITDASTTPLGRFAEACLLAPIEGESFASTYVAPMAMINALLVACAHADAKRTLEQLKPTDAEYGVGLRWYREPAATRKAAKRVRRKAAG
jgi:DNA-binding MurR/RpiR family transcriptional regulator